MNSKIWQSQQITIFLTLTSLLFGSIVIIKPLVTPRIASAIPLSQSRLLLALNLELPPKGAPVKRRNHAGTRDGYCSSDQEVIALVPGTHLGLTVAERPTFWFHIPYETNILEAEFLLEDNKGNEIHRQIVSLKNTPGIIKVRLPEIVSPLEIKKRYRWNLSVICDPNNRLEGDVRVYGEVKRMPINSDLESQLKDKNQRERIAIYAENGLWFDALTTLAELRSANSQDKALNDDWADLLQQVNLAEINSKPLVKCCTSEN